jgi:2-amino-4-hydroxy-6-hydroxymethyldihydropteridine diphosphokinase
MALPGGAPCVGEQPLEWPGRRTGLGVEDANDDAGHRASLARAERQPMGTVRAYVGLGANLGDAEATLAAGVHAMAALPGARLRGVSRLYATAPWGVTGQPQFRNAVVALDVPSGRDPATGAVALLVALKSLERAFGRVEREHWGPRELDLDLLVFGRARLSTGRPAVGLSADPAKAGLPLTVPHPEAANRLFVLAPLADLAPRLVPPGWPETVETARRRQAAAEGAAGVRPIGTWDAAFGGWR